jgi:hypothetical protein
MSDEEQHPPHAPAHHGSTATNASSGASRRTDAVPLAANTAYWNNPPTAVATNNARLGIGREPPQSPAAGAGASAAVDSTRHRGRSAPIVTRDIPSSPLVTPPGARHRQGPDSLAAVRTEAAITNAQAPFHRRQPTTEDAVHDPTRGEDEGTLTDAGKKIPKQGVPHVYHDFAQVLPDVDPMMLVRKKTGGVTQPFPEKLHEMLDSETSPAAQAVVSWLPHGRAFVVRKPKEFTSKIMPTYFRQTKLTSFQRQLNLYGFRRITQGADAGAYYHELFLRGRPSLSQRMVRQKVKGTGHKQPADASSEPNLYALPAVHPEFTVDDGNPVSAGAITASHVTGQVPGVYSSTSPRFTTAPPAVQLDSSLVASPSLHGAAHLLHGISTGLHPRHALPPTPFSGQTPSTMPGFGANNDGYTDNSNTRGTSSNESSSNGRYRRQSRHYNPASFLQPSATDQV